MPTKEALVQRTIIKDPLCDRCHATYETPLHALSLAVQGTRHDLGEVCSLSSMPRNQLPEFQGTTLMDTHTDKRSGTLCNDSMGDMEST